jgi:hypothetical protein
MRRPDKIVAPETTCKRRVIPGTRYAAAIRAGGLLWLAAAGLSRHATGVPHQFHQHYTREAAMALIPQLRAWLEQLAELRRTLEKYDQRLSSLMHDGSDAGGDAVNTWIRTVAAMHELLGEFRSREILIKDIERGLVDFPAVIGGREVFLCWEKDEETIEHWHELDAGYAGRERLE